jgi:hypothetical protein
MNNLNISATKSTPLVNFNKKGKTLSFSGQSYPENAASFYNDIFTWIEGYFENGYTELLIEFKLVYMNTSSTKSIMTLLDIMEGHFENNATIAIKWYYDPDNDIIEECGQDLSEDLTLPFELIEEATEEK